MVYGYNELSAIEIASTMKINPSNLNKNIDLLTSALDAIFRLAETIGYPYSNVRLPNIKNIESEFLESTDQNVVPCFNSRIDLNNLSQHQFFKGFEFQSDEPKEFSYAMALSVILEPSSFVLEFFNSLALLPVNQNITKTLIRLDYVNNIDLGVYSHPLFLVEYYKVLIGLNYPSRLPSSSPLPSLRHCDISLTPYCVPFTIDLDDAHQDGENYSVMPDILNKIQHDLAIQHFNKIVMNKQHPLDRPLIAVMQKNLLCVNEPDHKLFNQYTKYVNNAYPLAAPNPDDYNSILSTTDNMFEQFFVSFYAVQFLKAVESLAAKFNKYPHHATDGDFNHLNKNKPQPDSYKLHLTDLTLDAYGRVSTKNPSKLSFILYHYCSSKLEPRLSVDQALCAVHSEILENLKKYDASASCLPSELTRYIQAMFAAFDFNDG